MKITHVFSQFPNYSQPYNIKLIERLLASGIDCNVAAFKVNSSSTNLNIANLGYSRFEWLKYVYRCLIYFKKFKKYKKVSDLDVLGSISCFGRFSSLLELEPDIIHVHHIQLMQPKFKTFLKICSSQQVISVRGGDVLVRPKRSRKEKEFLIEIFKDFRNIHCVSRNLEDEIKLIYEGPIRCFTIHRSVEMNDPLVSLSKQDETVITTIGRVHWTKGYITALKALAILKRKGYKFKYHVCGSYDNEHKDELNYWISYYNLEKIINFNGHLTSDEINELLGRTSVYLQCSLSEGIPNTLTRSMYYRIPTVTTNAGGIPEVFRDGVDGIMVERGDEEAISAAIELLLNDADFRARIRSSICPFSLEYEIEMEGYLKMYKTISLKSIEL